ncbi:hypothetical protein WMF27_01520 [Sorangium sp. So ce281]|uniref:hypothetical protein n=1 Tax=unclassified Sorangium TaxID=2621164 RepID=UPI003F604DEE
MTEAQQWFEQLKQSIRDGVRQEMLQESIREGQLQELARQFEKTLGRPLADAERSVLASRFDRLGLDRLDDVRLERSAEALTAWLADPAAS